MCTLEIEELELKAVLDEEERRLRMGNVADASRKSGSINKKAAQYNKQVVEIVHSREVSTYSMVGTMLPIVLHGRLNGSRAACRRH